MRSRLDNCKRLSNLNLKTLARIFQPSYFQFNLPDGNGLFDFFSFISFFLFAMLFCYLFVKPFPNSKAKNFPCFV